MNKYQRVVIVIAAIDVLVMLLFPPFNDTPLRKGDLPSLEGFYPLISHIGVKPLNGPLLAIQLMLVVANAMAAYLCLETRKNDEIPTFNFTAGIAFFAAVNLATVVLFPPFQPYSSILRDVGASFDSFDFLWGNRSERPIFVPLLYLEVVFLAVNVLALWLFFNIVKRSDDAFREHLIRLAETMDESELARLTDEMRRRVEAHHAERHLRHATNAQETRHAFDPDYHGIERRKGRRSA